MIKVTLLLAAVLLCHLAIADTSENHTIAPEKTCEDFLPKEKCDLFRTLAKSLGESVSVVKDAIKSVVEHHITKASEVVNTIKEFIAERIKCENVPVLSEETCNRITEIGNLVHLTALQVKLAIEESVASGVKNAKDVLAKVIEFMTKEISCERVFGQKTCSTLLEAIAKFHETRSMIQQAIMDAATKHFTNARDLLKNTKTFLVEKAKNFKCEDLLDSERCFQLKTLTGRFKIKIEELNRLLKETVINGTTSLNLIYDHVIGDLIDEAKNLKCEDLIKKKTCDLLDAFAKNIHLKMKDVNLAVREAIAQGLNTTTTITTFVRTFLADQLSCDNFFSTKVCDSLISLAKFFGTPFTTIIEKVRTWVASGITNINKLKEKIKSFIFDNSIIGKRSIPSNNREIFFNKVIKLFEEATEISKIGRAELRRNIAWMVASGKYKLYQFKKIASDLIEKYSHQSDEEDPARLYPKSVIEQLKDLYQKAGSEAKKLIGPLIKKLQAGLTSFKDLIKSLGDDDDENFDEKFQLTSEIIEGLAYQGIDDELKSIAV